MKQEIKRKRRIIIFAFVAGLLGIGLFSYNFILTKIHLAYESINFELYDNKMPEEVNEEKEEVKKEDPIPAPKVSKGTYNPNYIGYLEISKINLKHGFVSMDSRQNNVDRNIQIIKPSNYPDIDKGNLIMASHSGRSSISYFKNLYKLKTGDIANITYKGNRYTYRIANIYYVPKKGLIEIRRDMTKSTLTLITCTKGNSTTQTVYVAYLESKVIV